MTRQERLFVIASIITCYLLQAQGADKYTDENRPYEFGFTIDGQQHRHEEKDKNGIVKGEYGFITADGVYHVTVYATDEQGRFKILSMKNIRYADYRGLSGAPAPARQGHSLKLPSPQSAITAQKSTSIAQPAPKPALELETISIEPPANSCSHCSIPTTSTAAPEPINIPANDRNGGVPAASGASNPINLGNNRYSSPANTPPVNQQNGFNAEPQNNFNGKQYVNSATIGTQGFGPGPQVPILQNNQAAPSIPQQPNEAEQPIDNIRPSNILKGPYVSGQQNVPGTPQYQGAGPQIDNAVQRPNELGKPVGVSGPPGLSQEPNLQGPQSATGGQQTVPNGQGARQQSNNTERSRSGKQYTGTPNLSTPQSSTGGSGGTQASNKPNQKPMLMYAQMQIVDKNTDIHAKRPGEQDGLPRGLNEDDMLRLLYTFNYTLGFQAHFEEGYTNGVKRGYYYTTGRNGVRTRIDYVADENGFRPTLSQEVLDLISDDVPKEDTEKDEKYGLKGYEFKWLYFPVESNSQ
ncbi:hypothetical protein O3G_MSEX005567 [Manduca sexta]|uniref:Cuticle protein n=1 Tax=Manduca sexta TaxID=7130 RepID=A0A921YZL8_MANSE|nr:hypothetical protein O3G_MSEX005567 [Manduca sexta]KAG6448605.1 hypothetical protein O3G_MSEX005567 [Manduca sexta]